MVQPDNDKSVRGKRLVFALLFGFIAFTLIMLYGTMWLGRATAPALKKQSEESVRRIRKARTPSRPPPAESN